MLCVARRNDPVVVRKLSVYDLGYKLDIRETEANLVGHEVDGDFTFAVVEQLAYFEHGLPRKDHFQPRIVSGYGEARERKPVAVGRDGLQRPLVDDQQHSIEVIADVLLRHREFSKSEQPPEVALRK